MKHRTIFSLTLFATLTMGLLGCTTEVPAPGDGASPAELARLRALGIEDVQRMPDGKIALVDRAAVDVGTVTLTEDGGFESVLRGQRASLHYGAEDVTWACGDGYTASARNDGLGLWAWLAADRAFDDHACGAALAAGWVAGGVFREPPIGCRRVLVGDDARLTCRDVAEPHVAGATEELLAAPGSCGYDSFGDSCMDAGWGCSAACSYCGDSFGVATSFGLECEGGGGGGGSGGEGGGAFDYCSNQNKSVIGRAWDYHETAAMTCPDERTVGRAAVENANDQCYAGDGLICRLARREQIGSPACTVLRHDLYCQVSCVAVVRCEYVNRWW